MLAAASYTRAAAGLHPFPDVPFGTRVMCVRGPAPRNAWLPRALPGTAFGPSDRAAGGLHVYQDGRVREVVNFRVTDLAPEELSFVKMHLSDYGAPAAPAPAPASSTWQPPPHGSASPGVLQDLLATSSEQVPAEAPRREEAPDDRRTAREELLDPQGVPGQPENVEVDTEIAMNLEPFTLALVGQRPRRKLR